MMTKVMVVVWKMAFFGLMLVVVICTLVCKSGLEVFLAKKLRIQEEAHVFCVLLQGLSLDWMQVKSDRRFHRHVNDDEMKIHARIIVIN